MSIDSKHIPWVSIPTTGGRSRYVRADRVVVVEDSGHACESGTLLMVGDPGDCLYTSLSVDEVLALIDEAYDRMYARMNSAWI